MRKDHDRRNRNVAPQPDRGRQKRNVSNAQSRLRRRRQQALGKVRPAAQAMPNIERRRGRPTAAQRVTRSERAIRDPRSEVRDRCLVVSMPRSGLVMPKGCRPLRMQAQTVRNMLVRPRVERHVQRRQNQRSQHIQKQRPRSAGLVRTRHRPRGIPPKLAHALRSIRARPLDRFIARPARRSAHVTRRPRSDHPAQPLAARPHHGSSWHAPLRIRFIY